MDLAQLSDSLALVCVESIGQGNVTSPLTILAVYQSLAEQGWIKVMGEYLLFDQRRLDQIEYSKQYPSIGENFVHFLINVFHF